MKIRWLRTVESVPGLEELFDWNRAWYPISPLDYLDADAPNPVKLLGKRMVVWCSNQEMLTLFFSDAIVMESMWGQFGGWENGKTKNLLVLFVLKHGWKMDFLWFSYAKSDEDWVYPNPRRIGYISMKHFPKNPGAKK